MLLKGGFSMNIMIWVWLGAVVIFGVAEGVTAGLVSIWFVAGAVAALIAAVAGASVTTQGLLFVAVSAVTLAATRPLVRRLAKRPAARTNADRVLGAEAKVTERIDNENSTGAVYVYGKTWTARSTDGLVIPVDAWVRVEKMEGVKLFVKLCEKAEAVQ